MRSLLLFLSFMLCFSFQADAQFGKKWKDKLAEKFGKKEQPTEEKNDENTEEEEEDEDYPAYDISSMFGGGDVELEESYNYDFSISWLVTSSDSKDEPTNMTQFFSTTENHFAMEMEHQENKKKKAEKVRMVLDFERKYMITLVPDEKQAVVMKLNDDFEEQVAENIERENEKKGSIEKTGNTKMIANHLCYQYLYKGEDGKGEIWATPDLEYKNYNMFNYMQQNNKRNNSNDKSFWYNGIEGFMLQISGEDENGDTFEMIATEVNEKADVSFKMADYEVMNMTNLPSGGNYPVGKRN